MGFLLTSALLLQALMVVTPLSPEDLGLRIRPPAPRASDGRTAAHEAVPDAGRDAGPEAAARFRDEISVELLSIAVRAVDRAGEPIRGLGPDDFRVRHRRREVPVLAVDWISPWAFGGPTDGEPGDGGTAPPPVRLDRLVVFWVQADVHAVRIKGHLRMLPFARELLAALHPEDRVAVVSFDSHLKLWLDFSGDREAAARAIERAVRFGAEPPPVRASRPSLSRHLDRSTAFDAATPERALEVTAAALAPLPGEKAVIFLGWGLGRWGSSGFSMTAAYERALRRLEEARAAVFVLDVTDADYHTLEIGLRQVAEDTGGTYAKTHLFARQVTRRLGRALRGHYLLTLDRSGLPAGARRFDVDLRGRAGTVLARAP